MFRAWRPPFILKDVSRRTLPAFSLPLAFASVTWAFNYVALKILYVDVPAPAVAFVRFATMYVLLLALCKLQGLSLKFDRRDALPIMLLGFVSMGVYMVMFLGGMELASASEGAILIGTSPIFTALIAVALRQERFSIGAVAGALIGFAGVALVLVDASKHADNRLLGNAILLGASVLWSYSAVLTKSLIGKYAPLQLLTMAMPAALVVLAPYGLVRTLGVDWAHLGLIPYALLFHLVVMSGLLGFLGFYAGIRQVGAGGAMMYQYLVPPLTVLFAWLLMGQLLSWRQLAGLVVVIVGVAVATKYRQAPILEVQTAQPEPAR